MKKIHAPGGRNIGVRESTACNMLLLYSEGVEVDSSETLSKVTCKHCLKALERRANQRL